VLTFPYFIALRSYTWKEEKKKKIEEERKEAKNRKRHKGKETQDK
jgi:hypothetical protein